MRMKGKIMNALRPWKTVSVVPLAGVWANRFRRKDGRMILDPCPGLLIQERAGESRAVFATYHQGILMPACEMDGFEEASCAGGPRANPYRADLPPWQLLDEIDPVQKAAGEAAAGTPLATSWVKTPGGPIPE